MTDHRLRVALGEYDIGWHDPAGSIAAAADVVARAAAAGAQVVVLPEMATTGFTMEANRAVPVDSTDVRAFQQLARDNGTWIIVGVALRDDAEPSCAVNTSLAIEPSGDIVAVHRKQRLFAYGGEDRCYAPGNATTIVTLHGVRIALFICYELRFPEVFAPAAPDVDAMILIANWPAARQQHWDVLLRARAIENQCYVIGVNRTGSANGLAYAGGSLAIDPWGDQVAPDSGNGARVVTIDAARTAEVRAEYPFQRDRM